MLSLLLLQVLMPVPGASVLSHNVALMRPHFIIKNNDCVHRADTKYLAEHRTSVSSSTTNPLKGLLFSATVNFVSHDEGTEA